MRYKFTDNINRIIDAHGLKIQGRGGVAQVFAKILEGSRLSGKIARVYPPISGFVAFLLASLLKFTSGVLCLPCPPHPSPLTPYPLCTSMNRMIEIYCKNCELF
jgi:hypothetical protein